MGLIQAAWMGVGFRMAMAPRESESHLSIPNEGKSAGGALVVVVVVAIVGVVWWGRFLQEIKTSRVEALLQSSGEPWQFLQARASRASKE